MGTKEIEVHSPVGRRVWFQKIPNLPGVRMPEFSKISATSLRRSHVSAIQFDPVLERRGMPTRGRHSTAGVSDAPDHLRDGRACVEHPRVRIEV